MSSGPAAAHPSRRAVAREALLVDIRRIARDRLAAEGKAGVTLRPIAKAVGLTAPALYRYYDSHEALLFDLVADLYAEVADVVVHARDADPHGPPLERAMAMVHAFRGWSLANPRAFELVFATPFDPTDDERPGRLQACTERFGAAWYDLFAQLWHETHFPVPRDDELDVRLRAQVAEWAGTSGTDLPLGALSIFLGCWVRIYGLISLEVFGQLRFALTDVSPMYELMMRDLAANMGLKPPSREWPSGPWVI